MSVRRLSEKLLTFENKATITADDVYMLRKAAGPKVSASELELMDSFVVDYDGDISLEAQESLRSMFGLKAESASSLELVSKPSLKVPEASGLVALGEGRFLVADDAKGIYYRDSDGEVSLLLSAKKNKSLRGLEGLCLSEDGGTLYAVSEDSRKVVSIALDGDTEPPSLSTPEVLGKLPSLGRTANKGWEGLSFLAADHSPIDEDCLVAVHEGDPRSIGIFTLPDLEEVEILTPPTSALRHLSDISDITVHPETGNLFVLSDESQSVVELALTTSLSAGPGALLESTSLETLHTYKLPLSKGQKPEGIVFSDESTMFIACDGSKAMLEMKLHEGN